MLSNYFKDEPVRQNQEYDFRMTTMKRLLSGMYHDSIGVLGECSSAKRSKTSDFEESTSINWSHLPDVVITEIFDNLNHTDRINVSSVCKHWRKNLYNKRWWKDITFTVEPDKINKARYLIEAFSRIVSHATIKLNTFSTECMEEFVSLIQILADNPNLKTLIIEPTHCKFFEFPPVEIIKENLENDNAIIKNSIMKCLPKLNKFSIGCIEDLSNEVENFLKLLNRRHSERVTVLGLASVKDEPGKCKKVALRPSIFKPFSGLEILSIDYDEMSDEFLNNLHDATNLRRLVVHLHSIRPSHPGTSNETWQTFKETHPECEFRLTVIHAFKDIHNLHTKVLRKQMPLSHLKVFFCESVNISVLECLSQYYQDTLRSLIWVDSLNQEGGTWAITTPFFETPDPFLLISWLCKKLEEIILYGYKYWEENLIAVARLRGPQLHTLEIAEDDILFSNKSFSPHDTCLKDIPLNLKRSWTPKKRSELHPVICNPTAGDSDEYLLPIVLADLH
ncbi:F-box/LRR-repeat protein 21 isoform X1 [Coccinella septempunctata]|uniref:F-box/LRR-repeat protein 21 isoform X1 n=1 Tax=Coccinella septempunctata TaxID=41139 RepID=UPI001D06B804|nr:F-box/LRR-repeat protein 21 isoform X1 [Coccinella septempunctata]